VANFLHRLLVFTVQEPQHAGHHDDRHQSVEPSHLSFYPARWLHKIMPPLLLLDVLGSAPEKAPFRGLQ
jgi:hypothetical protein